MFLVVSRLYNIGIAGIANFIRSIKVVFYLGQVTSLAIGDISSTFAKVFSDIITSVISANAKAAVDLIIVAVAYYIIVLLVFKAIYNLIIF